MNKNSVPDYQHFSLWPIFTGHKNSLLKNFFEDFSDVNPTKNDHKSFQPKINIEEKPEHYLVTAEVPGLREEDLTVTCEHDSLTIAGQKSEDFNREESGVLYQGRSYGKFSQTIPLNFTIREEQIEASLEKGVLKIILPKSKETDVSNRKIAIKTIN